MKGLLGCSDYETREKCGNPLGGHALVSLENIAKGSLSSKRKHNGDVQYAWSLLTSTGMFPRIYL